MWLLVLILLVLSLLALLFLHLYLRHFSAFVRQTSRIPGPKPKPLVGNYLDFGCTPQDAFANIVRMWKEYGNVYKYSCGPKYFIHTADPRHFEVLLSSTANISKGISYTYLLPWLGEGLLTSTGDKWKERRKMLTPAFHFKILEKFVEDFNRNSNILVKALEPHVNGEVFNIYEYISLCTLDVICETALGISVNAQESSTSEYVIAIKGLAKVFVKRLFSPWLHFDYFFFKWSRTGKEQEKFLNVLHTTANKVIQDRKQGYYDFVEHHGRNKEYKSVLTQNLKSKRKQCAFLDLLLEYSRDGGKLTNGDIREEVDTFMFEGHDTTASAVSFCLRLLALHPHIQDRVYEELKNIFNTSKRNTTFQDLNEMKYLECVIKESLRLYPSVPFFSRELDIPIKFDDLDLPAGTNVAFLVYCLHRNSDIFPDPEKFDPERFDPENSRGRHLFGYLPFSAGPRNCIGQKFAMLELKSIVSKVLRSYKLIAAENHDLVLSWEFVLRSVNGIFLKIERR